MKHVVTLFARPRDLAGRASLAVDLADGATAADALAALGAAYPSLTPLLPSCRLAVNQAFADPSDVIPAGAELALIPPVSGG